MDREDWHAAVHGVAESDMIEQLNWLHLSTVIHQQAKEHTQRHHDSSKADQKVKNKCQGPKPGIPTLSPK